MQLTLSLCAANWTFGRAHDGSAVRRARRAALAGFVALAAAAPAPAEAGTYGVHACRYGDGGAAGPAPGGGVSDWLPYARTTGTGETRFGDRCGAGDGASFHWEAGRNYRDNDQAGYRLQEKPGLQLHSVAWRGLASGFGGTRVSVQATTGDGSTPTLMDPQTGHDLQGDLRQWSIPAGESEVRLRVRCGTDYCDVGASGDARVFTARLATTVLDERAPTASGLSGPMTARGYKSGVQRVSFDAADVGSGLYRAHLEIDGARAAARTTGFPNPDSCRSLSSGRDFWLMQPCSASAPGSVAGVDTALLADGPHAARLVLEDASGGESEVFSTTLRVNNPGGTVADTACTNGLDDDHDGRLDFGDDAGCVSEVDTTEDAKGPLDDLDGDGTRNELDPDDDGDGSRDTDDPAPFDPGQGVKPIGQGPVIIEASRGPAGSSGSSVTARDGRDGATGAAGSAGSGGSGGSSTTASVDRGPLNGQSATPEARVLVSFAKTTKRLVRVPYGRPVGVTGRLVHPSGRPIRGAEVTILARTLVPGARFVPVATVVTDAAGEYRYLAPAGTSRVLRAAYRLHMNDVAYVSTSDVQVEVTPAVRLTTSKRTLRNKQSLTFRGSVAAAPASSRKVVELQAKVGSKWVTFATTRLKGGRFAHKYRFARTFRTTSYAFRVRVRPEPSWPFAYGTSKVVKVKVRP